MLGFSRTTLQDCCFEDRRLEKRNQLHGAQMTRSPLSSEASQVFHCLNDLIAAFATLRPPMRLSGMPPGLPRIDCEVKYGDEFQKVLVFSMPYDPSNGIHRIASSKVAAIVFMSEEIVELSADRFGDMGLLKGQFGPEGAAPREGTFAWVAELVKDGYQLTEVAPEQAIPPCGAQQPSGMPRGRS